MKVALAAAFAILIPAAASAQIYAANGDGTYRRTTSLGAALGYRQTCTIFRAAPASRDPGNYVQPCDYHALYEERLVTPDEVIEHREGFYGGGPAPTWSRTTTIQSRR